jgi:hypothetical protein
MNYNEPTVRIKNILSRVDKNTGSRKWEVEEKGEGEGGVIKKDKELVKKSGMEEA